MTILDEIEQAVACDETMWAAFIASQAYKPAPGEPMAWGRQGGSWGKEGEFFKK